MPTLTLTVTTDQRDEIIAALAFHQGRDVGDVTAADARQFLIRQLRAMVHKYRESQRNAANPVDTSEVAT